MTEKLCTKCKKIKPVSEFWKCSSRKDGLQGWCKPCHTTFTVDWYQRDGNAERLRAKAREEGRLGLYMRRHLLKKFGLSFEDFDAIVKSQGGKCALCGQPPRGKRDRLVIDHNHETGEHRGVICNHCNVGIGMLNDDPDLLRKAADYLETAKLKLVNG